MIDMPHADNDEPTPMITFSISKDNSGEVIVTLDIAEEFELLDDNEAESLLIQSMDLLEEMLMDLEDDWSGDDEPTTAA
jgi:hypothetical protein